MKYVCECDAKSVLWMNCRQKIMCGRRLIFWNWSVIVSIVNILRFMGVRSDDFFYVKYQRFLRLIQLMFLWDVMLIKNQETTEDVDLPESRTNIDFIW